MPSALLRRFAVTSLGLWLAVLASPAPLAQRTASAAAPQGPTGTISGRVTDASTGTPAVGLDVVFQNDVGRRVASATTDASGRYATPPLPVGDYYVRTASLNPLGLVPQFFDKVTAGDRALLQSWDEMKQCTTVTVTANRAATGIDFALERGGSISGVVTVAATGAPLRGVRVSADSQQSRVYAVTDAQGRYTTAGLRSGSYRITATPAWEGTLSFGVTHALFLESLLGQVHGAKDAGKVGQEAGTPLTVAAPGGVPGIDFALAPGGVIRGKVTWADSGLHVHRGPVRCADPPAMKTTPGCPATMRDTLRPAGCLLPTAYCPLQ